MVGPQAIATKSLANLPVTRWQTIRAGMWRGAKLGFVTFMVIAILLVLTGTVIFFLRDLGRTEHFLSLPDILGGMAAFFVFGLIYGAIPGALIMGIFAAVRWRHPIEDADLPNNQEFEPQVSNP
jgi:hypothetical protein